MPSAKVAPSGIAQPERSQLDKICRAEAGCLLNLICCPAVLIWQGTSFYLGTCLRLLLTRFGHFLWGMLCSCCCYEYTDSTFVGQAAVGNDEPADWIRARFLEGVAFSGKKMQLYEGKVEPADLCQGAVGDCWLVSAFACAAEQPATIRNVYITKEANTRGKYQVRLFDGQRLKWVTVVIDDKIPCAKGTKRPLFMKAHGRELWAILLEKACAKFCGSCARRILAPGLSARSAPVPRACAARGRPLLTAVAGARDPTAQMRRSAAARPCGGCERSPVTLASRCTPRARARASDGCVTISRTSPTPRTSASAACTRRTSRSPRSSAGS